MNPDVPKTSFDMEMGKRHAVVAEDFEEMQRQIDGVGRLERCATEPRHMHLDEKANWEMTPDLLLSFEWSMVLQTGRRGREEVNEDYFYDLNYGGKKTRIDHISLDTAISAWSIKIYDHERKNLPTRRFFEHFILSL